MSKRAKPIALAIGAAVTALLVLATWHNPEPSYQGKPLSYWIRPFLDTNGPYSRPSASQLTIATNALHHIGTNVIPLLVQWVAYDAEGRRNRLRRFLPKALRRTSLIYKPFVDPNKELRAVQPAAAVISFGPKASIAFPELGRILTDADLFGAGTTALWILKDIGEPAVAYFGLRDDKQT
jgi:hypothetical protein